MFRPKVLFPFLFTIMVLLPGTSFASRSIIENDMLLVPRVDVEGLSALQLAFHIVFADEYFFDLTDVAEASLSVANAASFDGAAMELDLFEIELANGDLFSARIGLVPAAAGLRFRLLEAHYLGNSGIPEPPVANYEEAESLYLQQCANCHGGEGQGTGAGPSLIGCANCGSLAAWQHWRAISARPCL
ncbi:MAG: hypothetical protein R3F50_14650 [Gammaproteobacteria bacterium]|jgi:hypothetical protein